MKQLIESCCHEKSSSIQTNSGIAGLLSGPSSDGQWKKLSPETYKTIELYQWRSINRAPTAQWNKWFDAGGPRRLPASNTVCWQPRKATITSFVQSAYKASGTSLIGRGLFVFGVHPESIWSMHFPGVDICWTYIKEHVEHIAHNMPQVIKNEGDGAVEFYSKIVSVYHTEGNFWKTSVYDMQILSFRIRFFALHFTLVCSQLCFHPIVMMSLHTCGCLWPIYWQLPAANQVTAPMQCIMAASLQAVIHAKRCHWPWYRHLSYSQLR